MKTRSMHKYVIGWMGVFTAFAATFPVAMMRVGQMPKFWGQAFHSQTCESKNPTEKAAVSWVNTCRHLKKEPAPKQ